MENLFAREVFQRKESSMCGGVSWRSGLDVLKCHFCSLQRLSITCNPLICVFKNIFWNIIFFLIFALLIAKYNMKKSIRSTYNVIDNLRSFFWAKMTDFSMSKSLLQLTPPHIELSFLWKPSLAKKISIGVPLPPGTKTQSTWLTKPCCLATNLRL